MTAIELNSRSSTYITASVLMHGLQSFECGAFDLFHAGHVLMLKEAKSVCEHLIVCVQTDPSVDRATKNTPVQSIVERQIQVSACKYVDEVIIY